MEFKKDPVLKSEVRFEQKGANICNGCHARKECVDNIDDWCQKYPCTSYNRKDGKAVAFKRVEDVK